MFSKTEMFKNLQHNSFLPHKIVFLMFNSTQSIVIRVKFMPNEVSNIINLDCQQVLVIEIRKYSVLGWQVQPEFNTKSCIVC